MAKRKPIQEMRQKLNQVGLHEMDDLSVARLAKAQAPIKGKPGKKGPEPEAGPGLDPDAVRELLERASSAKSEEDFVNSVMIGPCPFCRCESTHLLVEDGGEENPVVGVCDKCERLFCTECQGALSVDALVCERPECWLNQEDELESLGEPGEPEDEEPEL